MYDMQDQPVAGPTVVRRQLGRRLREMRREAGKTPEQLGANPVLGMSKSKIYRLEAGNEPARPQDVATLARHYGADDAEIDNLATMALGTKGFSWWHAYGADAVDTSFSLYADVEPAAINIRTYEAGFVPGLLQTADYAWHASRNPDGSEADREQRVAARMRRQAILHRPDPPLLHAVIDEGCILRQVGGQAVRSAQLDKLRQMAELPNVNIDVVPFSRGMHAALEGAFALLDFADPAEDPSVVCIEIAGRTIYLQEPADLDRYRKIFDNVCTDATPIKEYMP